MKIWSRTNVHLKMEIFMKMWPRPTVHLKMEIFKKIWSRTIVHLKPNLFLWRYAQGQMSIWKWRSLWRFDYGQIFIWNRSCWWRFDQGQMFIWNWNCLWRLGKGQIWIWRALWSFWSRKLVNLKTEAVSEDLTKEKSSFETCALYEVQLKMKFFMKIWSRTTFDLELKLFYCFENFYQGPLLIWKYRSLWRLGKRELVYVLLMYLIVCFM